MKLTLDTEFEVFFYEQEFYVLSNFSAFNVDVFGRDFQTSEHAYHWKKFCDTDTGTASLIRHARSAHDGFVQCYYTNSGSINGDLTSYRIDDNFNFCFKKHQTH